MKTYGIKLDCNAPAVQRIDVPANSELQISPQIMKNGQLIDFTLSSAPGISAWCDGVMLSSDKTIDKSPCFKLSTDNGGKSKVDVYVEDSGSFEICLRKSGSVYENDEVGGGGEVPADLSVASLTVGDALSTDNNVTYSQYFRTHKLDVIFNTALGGTLPIFEVYQPSNLSSNESYTYCGRQQKSYKIGNRPQIATVCNGWFGAKTAHADSKLDVGLRDAVSQGLSTDYNGIVHIEGSNGKIELSGSNACIQMKSPTSAGTVDLKPIQLEIGGHTYVFLGADITPAAE